MPPKPLPVWSAYELDTQRSASREVFRRQRIEEPVEEYTDLFEEAWQDVSEVLELTVDLTSIDPVIKQLVRKKRLRRAFRYMTGPPISDDDLKLLADAQLTAAFLKANPETYERIRDVVLLLLDRRRLPWVGEDREAEEGERETAKTATAAQIAAQALQASRRNKARVLEAEVADALVAAGYRKVAKRTVATAQDWPAPGEFCGEGKVAERQADLIVTLFDGRYLPIECKVSASELNSIKRLNNDSIGKFATWTTFFGQGQTLPVAVLEGAFARDRLQAAQNAGAGIFWRHELKALQDFVSP